MHGHVSTYQHLIFLANCRFAVRFAPWPNLPNPLVHYEDGLHIFGIPQKQHVSHVPHPPPTHKSLSSLGRRPNFSRFLPLLRHLLSLFLASPRPAMQNSLWREIEKPMWTFSGQGGVRMEGTRETGWKRHVNCGIHQAHLFRRWFATVLGTPQGRGRPARTPSFPLRGSGVAWRSFRDSSVYCFYMLLRVHMPTVAKRILFLLEPFPISEHGVDFFPSCFPSSLSCTCKPTKPKRAPPSTARPPGGGFGLQSPSSAPHFCLLSIQRDGLEESAREKKESSMRKRE